jgi:two-component system OmpR family sensor kinase
VTAAAAIASWGTAVVALTGALLARLSGLRGREQVARAAHELRGPITAARLGLALGVRRGALAGAPLRAVELELERASLALEDLAACGGAGVPPQVAEVDIAALLGNCAEAWRPAALARGGDVHLRCSPGPAFVDGDRLRLAQALDNLIANGIEHGGGTVEVFGRLDAGSVRVEVRDRGPGMPAPVAELARHARRGRGSRGRGLAIAASIAREHGGRLGAAPSEQGARLLIELPRRWAARHGRRRQTPSARKQRQDRAQTPCLHETVQAGSFAGVVK